NRMHTIKAVMAENGTVIEGYNDDLSTEDLKKITGSTAVAQEITTALQEKDLPVTEDNLKNMTEALQEAEQVSEVTDSMMKYLLKNHIEPTVENLYLAEFSAGEDQNRQAKGYYRENGYLAQKAEEINWEQIAPHVDRVIEEAGLTGTEGVQQDARWTIEAGIPLTADNLKELHELKQVTLPMPRKELLHTLTDAIVVGKKPQQANLAQEKQTNPIHLKRVLEETRLQMSIEANRSLLRKGLTIDTNELERAVEQLKEAEKELFGQALDVIQEIAFQPAESIQKAAFDTSTFTLKSLHEIGQPIQKSYEQAMQTYEAVWTAPRADLGDSIQKAFQNVDDLLTDLDADLNEVNRKAVRIMGYTQTPVTEENFERVRQATQTVLDVIEQMTPEKTLQMVREGINPLSENMYDLLSYLKQKPESERTERYSEYIWKLDKSGAVSEEEKDAYIGIYRLIRQIEKNDGRPIGDVLSSDEELTLQNLLSAIRSRKASGMDVSIDDAFGTLEELKDSGTSITAQITEAFEKILRSAHTPEADLEYAKQLREESVAATKVSDSVIQALLDAECPVNTDNLLAAEHLMHMRGDLFKKLYQLTDEKKDEKKEKLREKLTEFVDKLDEEDSPAQAYDEMMEAAQTPLEEETYQSTDVLRIRELQMMHKQLYVARKMAQRESYEFSMEIGGELTGVNLKIIRGSDDAQASVHFENELFGEVAARFSLLNEAVTGYVSGTREEGIAQLKERQEAFATLARRDVSAVSYLSTDSIRMDTEESGHEQDVSVRKLYGVVKAFLKSI
ncbi:MAG: hypothetical protein IKS87_08190, partial [Lachnospiraceae bacterium]|nr:hypothetical protein [Lachnospiraceae bacterium]